MPKKVVIKESNLEASEEAQEEVLEHVEPAETQMPSVDVDKQPQQQPPQKAEGRTRMRELYRCEFCNKYLTKKALNYSHAKYCKGQQQERAEEPEPVEPQAEEDPPSRLSIMEQIRQERYMLKQERIRRLAQNIA